MANYFSHDSNARNSDKLIRLRMKYKAAGYGVYFMILERLREEEGYMSVKDYNMIAFDLREDTSLIKSVVEDFGLFVFTEDGEYFYSESFNARMEKMETTSESRSIAGKMGAEKRWGKKKASNPDNQEVIKRDDGKTMANATETDGKTMANATKSDSNKIKEIKININPPKSPKGDISPLPGDVPTKSSQKRFQKPTVGEIDAYCKERGNGVDPQRFFDYYESKGWVVGKSPMKDWKAAVRTWERQDKDMKPYQPQAPPLQSPEEEEAEVMRILQERKSRKDNGL